MKSILIPAAVAIFALVSCNKPATEASAPPPPADSLDPWFSAEAPPAPQAIHVVRHQAAAGDEVTVSGKIMGRAQPFVDGRAAFVLGDPAKITPCSDRPDDECATPWDTCCDSKEAIREGTATVQLVGDNGRVLNQGLKGVHGLTELSTVTVTGTIDKASTPEALIINATTLHVEN